MPPIERLLRKNGRFWWLEDPMQNLYLRKSVELPGWVEVRAMANHRSPHDVVRFSACWRVPPWRSKRRGRLPRLTSR